MVETQFSAAIPVLFALIVTIVGVLSLFQLRSLLLRGLRIKTVDRPLVLTKILHKDLPVSSEYLKPRQKPTKRSKATLIPLPLVEYNPTNDAHQVALYMMIAHQRLHPTLRFTFDTSQFESAYHFCLLKQAEASIPKHLREAADNIVRRHLRKVQPKIVRKSKKKAVTRKVKKVEQTQVRSTKKRSTVTPGHASGGVVVTLNKTTL
jgi:hypothetical protein